MPTVLPNAQPIAAMPIWAQLQLAARGIALDHVTEWSRAAWDDDLIAVITVRDGLPDYAIVTRTAA
ncbi:hypothetical protein [Kitasatospora sp. NPDC056531]|uniref:hypothetical protein n=1 Tax=Kitasatospora sp. NPDC056531 TaxID=3345856 RepID=UPI0036BCD438